MALFNLFGTYGGHEVKSLRSLHEEVERGFVEVGYDDKDAPFFAAGKIIEESVKNTNFPSLDAASI